MKNTHNQRLMATAALAMLLALAGCGGGSSDDDGGGDNAGKGDSGGNDAAALAYTTDHLDQANASSNVDASGAGVIVGVVDGDVRRSHDALVGRIANLHRVDDAHSAMGERDHGTAVASMVVGPRVGVASGARLDLVVTQSVDLANGEPGAAAGQTATGIEYLAGRPGVSVLNISSGPLQQASADAITAGIQSNDWVVTIAAGNGDHAARGVAGDADADVFAGHVLAVGALDPSGEQIAPFNNGPTAGEMHYLVAPGTTCAATDRRDGPGTVSTCTSAYVRDRDVAYNIFDGTSVAAPLVAGAAALIRQVNPGLSGDQVVDVLLNTADDLGDPGVDSVYGAGALNVKAAVARAQALKNGTATASRIAYAEPAGANRTATAPQVDRGPAIPVGNGEMMPVGENAAGCTQYTFTADDRPTANMIYYRDRRGNWSMQADGCMPSR